MKMNKIQYTTSTAPSCSIVSLLPLCPPSKRAFKDRKVVRKETRRSFKNKKLLLYLSDVLMYWMMLCNNLPQ